VVERIGDIDPVAGQGGTDRDGLLLPVVGVAVGIAAQLQRLEPSALAQLARGLGDEAVEGSVTGVLGLVDDAGARIDGHRFAAEAAHGGERHGIGEAGHDGGRHIKGEAVGLIVAALLAGAGLAEVFLAGDP
jgi:hypothetical protein